MNTLLATSAVPQTLSSADLSRDPQYRALVRMARLANGTWDTDALTIVSDYREERGLPRLAKRSGRLARKEKTNFNAYAIDWREPEVAAREEEAAASRRIARAATARIGPRMQAIVRILTSNGPMAIIDVAHRVGPHGSLCYGYATVNRALRAGIVVYGQALPGRRGGSIQLPE
jgi:hypothetical protein